jgi:hypothetical protein
MPINYSHYPPNWFSEIRPAILARAGDACERCHLPNGILGHRDRQGTFWPYPDSPPPGGWTANTHLFKIILTIAHLDHDTTNNQPSNLQALCQHCHLTHDLPHHRRNAALTRRRRKLDAGQIELIDT